MEKKRTNMQGIERKQKKNMWGNILEYQLIVDYEIVLIFLNIFFIVLFYFICLQC